MKQVFDAVVLAGYQDFGQRFQLQLSVNELEIQAKHLSATIKQATPQAGELSLMARRDYNAQIQNLYAYVTACLHNVLLSREEKLSGISKIYDTTTQNCMQESMRVLKCLHQLLIDDATSPPNVSLPQDMYASVNKMREHAQNCFAAFQRVVMHGELLPSTFIRLHYEQDQFEHQATAVRSIIQRSPPQAGELARMAAQEYVNLVNGLYQEVATTVRSHFMRPEAQVKEYKPLFYAAELVTNNVLGRLQEMRRQII
jgi:hypothetical protein